MMWVLTNNLPIYHNTVPSQPEELLSQPACAFICGWADPLSSFTESWCAFSSSLSAQSSQTPVDSRCRCAVLQLDGVPGLLEERLGHRQLRHGHCRPREEQRRLHRQLRQLDFHHARFISVISTLRTSVGVACRRTGWSSDLRSRGCGFNSQSELGCKEWSKVK